MDLFVCQGGRSWSLEEITLSLVICLIAKFAEVLVLIVDITRTLLRQPSSEGYTCSHYAVSDNCGPLTMPSHDHQHRSHDGGAKCLPINRTKVYPLEQLNCNCPKLFW